MVQQLIELTKFLKWGRDIRLFNSNLSIKLIKKLTKRKRRILSKVNKESSKRQLEWNSVKKISTIRMSVKEL